MGRNFVTGAALLHRFRTVAERFEEPARELHRRRCRASHAQPVAQPAAAPMSPPGSAGNQGWTEPSSHPKTLSESLPSCQDPTAAVRPHKAHQSGSIRGPIVHFAALRMGVARRTAARLRLHQTGSSRGCLGPVLTRTPAAAPQTEPVVPLPRDSRDKKRPSPEYSVQWNLAAGRSTANSLDPAQLGWCPSRNSPDPTLPLKASSSY